MKKFLASTVAVVGLSTMVSNAFADTKPDDDFVHGSQFPEVASVEHGGIQAVCDAAVQGFEDQSLSGFMHVPYAGFDDGGIKDAGSPMAGCFYVAMKGDSAAKAKEAAEFCAGVSASVQGQDLDGAVEIFAQDGVCTMRGLPQMDI